MSDFSLIKCPQFLDNAITPVAKEIGSTLGNIFYLVFSPINYNVDKLKIKHTENLNKFERDIKNNLSKIPEEKLIEPKLSIIGPVLEASKFYIEEYELRKMFAKLIASSMNLDTNLKVHTCFVELIKQLNQLDAYNLKIIFKEKQFQLIDFLYLKEIAPEYHCGNFHQQNSSLDNLQRLGMTETNYIKPLGELIGKASIKPITDPFQELNDPLMSKQVFPTSLGRDFCETCI